MRYADRDGNIYEEENGQDRLLHWMYTTMAGRASLKILIRPWVVQTRGAFLKFSHLQMSDQRICQE